MAYNRKFTYKSLPEDQMFQVVTTFDKVYINLGHNLVVRLK